MKKRLAALTTVMLLGNQQDNMKCVVEMIDSIPAKKNYIVAPGCDMPFDVPVENTIGCIQAVLETDAVREMVKNYVAEDDNSIEIELP
ncbi:MAG: uroporphyrinogen decarboxylase, partial [Oscillibacter sp.]|nr:uroporphyrinogen decarboxylase [Oscillibacter sp.]